ncbi:hypothetical protein N0V94_002096 [Neodidymelliopsis sp. IMI 364377]|nr:hypothetical protein N0V94_002096 [Neodidymelliopsis sp. IMI 364377]
MTQDPNLLSPRSASGFSATPSPTTPVSPLNEPGSYNGGDISMENIYASPLASPDAFTRGDKSGSYMSLNGPFGKLDSDNQSLLSHHSRHPHTKHFDHNEARKYLFRTGGYKLLVTILFSALICVTLKAWEGFHGPVVLSKKDVRIFNSLMIGLSLCLGLNLLASLQNYAGILRWSLLSRRYVSLEVFDLMLGLERLSNVVKLMVISLPLVRRRNYLRRFSWFKDVRQDGTKWSWLVCLLWLAINVGSQVLVAVSSLFYPMDTSELPLLTYGDVTVANLTQWHTIAENTTNSKALDREAAWMYGMEAIVYPDFAPNDTQKDLSGLPGTPLYKHNNSYEYRFFNRNPNSQYSDYLLSSRNVSAEASCHEVDLRSGEIKDTGEYFYLEGKDGYKHVIPQHAAGALTWIASVNESCGARCTNFTVLQEAWEPTVNKTSLFLCNSTVSEVKSARSHHDITNLDGPDSKAVFGTDEFLRTASGAMGWTGIVNGGWSDLQFRTYTQGSRWSPASNVNVSAVEDMLMRFTIGAIAAFDDHGIRHNVTKQHVVPTKGQQLDVDWSYMLSILGGICGIQFAALCCLLLFANRTIVRDESFFSIAMLLSPVVGRIGREGGGMNMSGDEIKQHRKLMWKKIRYDYREGQDGEPHKVDIFFEGKDSRESRKSWAAGAYS